MMKTKEKELLDAAAEQAKTATTWADLSNFLFDPEEGLIALAYQDAKSRREFMKSAEYKAIRALIAEKQEQTGFVAGSTPTKSGKFVVRLPRSLHAALETEAQREGVSMNQLVIAKLAVQMSDLV